MFKNIVFDEKKKNELDEYNIIHDKINFIYKNYI